MTPSMLLALLLLSVIGVLHKNGVHSIRRELSDIRYQFTTCGASNHDGPSYEECVTHYKSIQSPILNDGVLFQFDEEGFQGGQGFRVPRSGVYNVTIAGAAGGRGLCNIYYGFGRRLEFQIRLSPEYELLVMVGQKGKSPCDVYPDHPLCEAPPTSMDTVAQCNQSWCNITEQIRLLYNFTSGGAGGGASMLRARSVKSQNLFPDPIAIAGGGGGSPALLDYELAANLIISLTINPPTMDPMLLYRYHMNAKQFGYTDVEGGSNFTRGIRPLSQFSIIAGAGGGWTAIQSSTDADGKALSQSQDFAEGGFDCLRDVDNIFREVDGGFGGGGGECGGGGGGGGYTGGSVLAVSNIVPGGGGHSVAFTSESIPVLTPIGLSFNDDDGYIEIIPANCNCTGYCKVNTTDDTFECFCPNNTSMALDDFDCYRQVSTRVDTQDVMDINGFNFQALPFLNTTVELFSIHESLTLEQETVCAIVFLDKGNNPVAVSGPVTARENLNATLLARSEVSENYSSAVVSDYVHQLSSSVEVIGAVLVSNGTCYLNQPFIAMNISTREPKQIDYNNSFEDAIANIALIARHILQPPTAGTLMPPTTKPTTKPTTQPTTQPVEDNGLTIGLVVAIVLLIILFMVVISAIVISYRCYKPKSKMAVSNKAPAINIEGIEPRRYAELNIETEERSNYSKLQTPEMKQNPIDKHYHTLEEQGRELSTLSTKDEGYEVLEYDDYDVVRTLPLTLSGAQISPPYGIVAPNHDFTQYNRDRASSEAIDWQYPRNKLIYIRELGEGQFGKVLLMKAQGIAGFRGKIPVAVKTLTSRDPTVISKFMEEADLMKKFSHPNIVSMLGISSESEDDDDDSAPLVILEYMPYGDLQGFLENHKPDADGRTVIREKHFHTFACDIALALDFLADNHYVHRDVAARNCLVSTDLHIKLADFGLSREIYEKDYYKIAGKAMLPVRWMAPECLIYGIFTTAGDVWSYGVVLWEITSYGDSPLDDMEAKDIVDAAQKETLKHSRPGNCPDYLYTLMMQCHAHEASERPSFKDILGTLAREQTQYEEFTASTTVTSGEDKV